ncbi:MAG: DUF2202 domain-containing protein [Polyangiaceae bacterium]|nr:DUF2202 domain-containing protein [Polyangiaceae bacterium]
MREALADEQQAEARYEVDAKTFGAPFPRLERAESRHADLLAQLLRSHGEEAPSAGVPAPSPHASVAEACATGVAEERSNIAMYDRLIGQGMPDDVRCVFEHLRDRSKERHLPALERCGSGGRGP